MPEVNCIACSVNITTSRTRRLLMSPSSQRIDGIVAEVLEEVISFAKRINTGLLSAKMKEEEMEGNPLVQEIQQP